MSENDPELDATWRAASREQPPAALDDAIRAAARREVGAKPGGFGAAPRWWPLAAAATVAAIAVGIVQMTPPEQVTPGTNTAANNAATDAAQRNVKPDSDTSNANKPQREAPGPAAAPEALRDASKPTAKEQRRGAGRKDDRGDLVRQRSESFAAAPGAQFQQKKALESRQQAPPQRVEEASERDQDLKRKAELAAASSAARPNRCRLESAGFSSGTQRAPAISRDPGAGRVSAPATLRHRWPPQNRHPHLQALPPPAPAVAARKLAAQSSATGALSGNNAGSSAGKIAGNAEPAPAQDTATLEKKAPGTVDKVTAERRKDTAPLAPDEWIKRIRRLIAEGKNDDAVKELVVFRREYKERAETLLPADLRAFRP